MHKSTMLIRYMQEAFVKSYLSNFRKRTISLLSWDSVDLAAEIRARAAALYDASQALIVDAPAADNVRITALVLASYEALRRVVPDRKQALTIIHAVLVEPNKRKIQFFSGISLRLSRDPLKLLASISRSKQKTAYGRGFAFEEQTDDMKSYFITNVRRCLYHDFFVANGAPELTPVFCAWDDVWGDVIQPAKHGVRFDRPATLANGGDTCRFEFRRARE